MMDDFTAPKRPSRAWCETPRLVRPDPNSATRFAPYWAACAVCPTCREHGRGRCAECGDALDETLGDTPESRRCLLCQVSRTYADAEVPA